MNELTALTETLRRLVDEPDPAMVREALDGERVEDLAAALERLPTDEGLAILRQLDEVLAADLMVELPTEVVRQYARELPDQVLAAYLDVLPMDDAIDLQEELGEERFEGLLELIPEHDASEIRRLLRYEPGQVGRLVTERFFHVRPADTMETILHDLRLASEDKYETVNDLYVLDEKGFLHGVFSLRKALRVEPETRAEQVMNEDVVTAQATETDEEAARRMAKYGFYALPVLDERGRMIGIFTGDDAQTILREAESEDVLALGAVSGAATSYLSLSPWQLFARRAPWLMVLFVAETLTGAVMRHYALGDDTAGQVGMLALMPFVPLIIGAGGNSGSQVTTTITRALALGEVDTYDAAVVFFRELFVAVLIGLALGAVGYARAALGWNSGPVLSLIVGLALPAVVVWAAMVGSLLPLAAKRLGIDPAVMSAPFITTFVDATGLIIFFEIALRLMRAGGL